MGRDKARPVERGSSPGPKGRLFLESRAGGSPSLESRAGLAPHPEPGLMAGGQDPKARAPTHLPTGSRDPKDSVAASGYVTTADLTLTPATVALSASQSPSLSLPSDQNPSSRPGLAGGPPISSAPLKLEVEGSVMFPPGLFPPSVSVALPAASIPILSPEDPQTVVSPASPCPMGLFIHLAAHRAPLHPLQLWSMLRASSGQTLHSQKCALGLLPWPRALANPSVMDTIHLRSSKGKATAGLAPLGCDNRPGEICPLPYLTWGSAPALLLFHPLASSPEFSMGQRHP